ncbi:MAG: efflux RND transporter periplasmic adaptor subunit [Edaphobacter sp.]|uniref:efflux RND transporter periplasmic adaptor subunit n=1 Tax=Edaphobacter sp. TaxID=1934404 RepID=UPI00238F0305|nr:efflux RND transporter periplasmic adaptor subunit [Edaphobacter sp.]MDE1176340.1 efflux RND transporter periplasmic adaptor subunit [Edaphobacter sp.]
MGPGGPGGASGTSVTTEKIQSGTMDIYLDALGTVTPLQTVNVYSQVSGRVLAVNYREGQIIQKGQSLVEVDPRPLQAQLQQSEGSLARDRAALEQDRINLKRYQDAYAEKAVSEQTVFDQQAAVRQAEGTVQNDEGSVQYYKVQLSYCHIVAPITGRIGLRLIDPGNTIFSGSSSTIATITQLNPITAVFSIAEDHMPQVQKQIIAQKQSLPVDLYDRSQETKLATGQLLTFDNQVDTSTGTVRLRAKFDNASNTLFPNQFVNARLQVNRLKNAKLISTAAIQYNGQQAFVYVVQPDSTVKLTNIAVTNSEQSKSAIEGLNVGDTVITSNFDRVQDGAKVTVAGTAPATPATNAGPAR